MLNGYGVHLAWLCKRGNSPDWLIFCPRPPPPVPPNRLRRRVNYVTSVQSPGTAPTQYAWPKPHTSMGENELLGKHPSTRTSGLFPLLNDTRTNPG